MSDEQCLWCKVKVADAPLGLCPSCFRADRLVLQAKKAGLYDSIRTRGGNTLPTEAVNHPSHYTSGGIETIDYIKAKLSPEAFEGYLQGNILKYMSRYQLKAGVEDLQKARWYLERLIYLRTPYNEPGQAMPPEKGM